MSETIQHHGQTLWVVPFGPLEIVSLKPLTAEELENSWHEDAIWGHLGLRIDPRQYGHDAKKIARTILLFMSFEENRTGVSWTTDPHSLAARIFHHTEPVIVPLWKDV